MNKKSIKEQVREQLKDLHNMENLDSLPIKTITILRSVLYMIGFVSFLFVGIASFNPGYFLFSAFMFVSLILYLKKYLELKESFNKQHIQ